MGGNDQIGKEVAMFVCLSWAHHMISKDIL